MTSPDTRPPWRQVEVAVPPEDPRFTAGWWVNTRTGECVDGSLPSPRPANSTGPAKRHPGVSAALAVLRGEGEPGAPRAVAPTELQGQFMDTCRNLVDYWASDSIAECRTVHGRLSGLMHSILCIFDGAAGDLPAFDITARPHPEDKQYHQNEGENWIEDGTVINSDDCLHEILYNHGAWRRS